MRKPLSTLAFVFVLALAALTLTACSEGTSDDATINNEASVTNEETAAAPEGANTTGEQFSEGMSDDATVKNEASVKNEAAAATPDSDTAKMQNGGQ